LVAAGLGPSAEHALISLLALNGPRVSEATGADIEHLGLERGHRTLTITRKGGKVATIPLAPRTARAIDMAIAERTDGPVFLAADGRRLDRHGAGRVVRKTARRAGIGKTVTPHTLRHAFITAALDAGSRYATCRKPPHMLIRAPRCCTTGPAGASTGTPPTSSPPTSRAPPGNGISAGGAPPAVTAAGRSLPHDAAVTHGDPKRNANRR
jgi:Phage integrase family